MDPSRWQNLGYLFWAYTLIWLLLAGYLLHLGRRLRQVQDEVRRLRSAAHGGERRD